jgi:hypothetical protein
MEKLIFFLSPFIFMILVGCKTKTSNPEENKVVISLSEDSVALQYARYINTKDTIHLIAFTSDTLTILSQEWESIGEEPSLSDSLLQHDYIKNEIGNGINRILGQVTLEDDSSVNLMDSTIVYFKNINDIRQTNGGYVFLRYTGDVEHVLILVLDENKRVRLIYLN